MRVTRRFRHAERLMMSYIANTHSFVPAKYAFRQSYNPYRQAFYQPLFKFFSSLANWHCYSLESHTSG
jgi:hypothetical protein